MRASKSVARLLLAAALVVLAGCRLDADVGVNVLPDGSGAVQLRAVIDAEVVAAVPTLRSALQLHDVTGAGWIVDGPTDTESGGLELAITHGFSSLPDANALLASLGPPLSGLTLTRTQTETEVITELAGSLTLPGGTFDAFGDADLIAAIGGSPFAAELAAAGVTPASAMTVELRVELPGRVDAQNGGRLNPEGDDGSVQEFSDVVLWTAPLDGSVAEISARAVYSDDTGGDGGLPSWVGPAGLIAAGVWLLAGALVAWRMWQAQQRRRHRPRSWR